MLKKKKNECGSNAALKEFEAFTETIKREAHVPSSGCSVTLSPSQSLPFSPPLGWRREKTREGDEIVKKRAAGSQMRCRQ